MNDFNLQGLITALITPFKEDGSLDFTALKKLINFQIDNGSDAIVVCSTTGESPTLTTKDRQSLVVRAVEYAAGRIPVIVGTGTNETQNALDQTTLAKEAWRKCCTFSYTLLQQTFSGWSFRTF